MDGLLWEGSFVSFFVMTVVIAGAAAWATGRAIADTWRPKLLMLAYVFLLSFALRFFHFALFGDELLSLRYWLVDLVILLVMAEIGFRMRRRAQMTEQYRFLFAKSGLLGWSRR